MANLTTGNGIGFDMFDWQEWGFDQFLSSSKTHYEYRSHENNTVQITGTGFAYDKEGNPIAGTVTTVSIYDGKTGTQIASLVLGDTSLVDLAANDFNSIWEILLQGDDVIVTGNQQDFVSGYTGNDYISAGGGNDAVFGGAGDDILNGDRGNDTVFGDDGDDTIIFNPEQGDDRIYGGNGADTVVTNGLLTEEGFVDNIQIEKIFGSEPASPAEDYNVLLEIGSNINSGIPGEPGRFAAELSGIETIEVNSGDDNDSLHVDSLTGTSLEDGHIIYDGGAGDDDLFALETGTDITYLWRFAEGEGHAGGGQVRFGNGDQDTIHLVDETSEVNTITLDLSFSDTLHVTSGITGSPFDKTLSVFNAEHLVFDFGDGDNYLDIEEDLAPAYDGVIQIDFGDGNNLLDVTGSYPGLIGHAGRIEAIGGDDHNAFFSGGGDDLLVGGAANDDIDGAAGNDEIYGGASGDQIVGGAGDDDIWGGDGGDHFIFNQGSGTDTIYDFVAGKESFDVLDFQSLDIKKVPLQIEQIDADTHITTPYGDTVILQNVTATDLQSGDILF